MNTKRMVMAGVDIGGTNTAVGLVDREGQCLRSVRFSTKAHNTSESFVEELVDHIGSMAADSETLLGIGIGAPNGNFYSGRIEHAPNLTWEPIVDLSSMTRSALSLPVVLTNDANAAALGEGLFGGAKGMKDYVMVTIGTGLGSGIVTNGKLLYGHTGFAGEMGHITAVPDGRQCSCGKKGCLETYVSARGLVQTSIDLCMERVHDTSLNCDAPGELTAQAVYQASQHGDTLAIKAFEQMGTTLGRTLADAVAFTSPEAIFLFGGICSAGALLMEPTRKSFEAHLLPMYKDKVELLQSSLSQQNAAVLGAAALAWNQQ